MKVKCLHLCPRVNTDNSTAPYNSFLPFHPKTAEYSYHTYVRKAKGTEFLFNSGIPAEASVKIQHSTLFQLNNYNAIYQQPRQEQSIHSN